MSFVYPSFLWALLALAIPILIHLFHFRRFKTVYFTNVKFLKQLQEESSSQRKIRNLLVLLMRCLAVAFLVFAFAQPFIPAKNSAAIGFKDVSIYIDNTFSMQASQEDVPLLEKAKQRALEIASGYEMEDRFQVITADFEGRDQRLLSKEEAIARIKEVELSYAVKPLEQAKVKQIQTLELGTNGIKHVYQISDFQKNIAEGVRPINKDSSFTYHLVPLTSTAIKNVSIDSVWFETPVQLLNQNNQLVIRLRNLSDVAAENVPITLYLNGTARPCGVLSIPARSSATDTINVSIQTVGWQKAELRISDYPVEFDDHYFISFNVKKEIDVLQIYDSEPNRNVNAAFQANGLFRLQNASSGQLDYSKLADYELIVLSDVTSISSGMANELSQYIKNGGNLVAFPSVNADLSSWQNFGSQLQGGSFGSFEGVSRSVSQINYDEHVFHNVFITKRENIRLPETKGNFRIQASAFGAQENLLTYRDGQAFLSKFVCEKGNYYLCAAPLNVSTSNLVQNAEIFVPMLVKMALAKGKTPPIAYFIGRNNVIETDVRKSGNEILYKLKNDQAELIPEQKQIGNKTVLTLRGLIKQAGWYQLYLNPGEVLEQYAFNYDRRESDMSFMTADEIEALATTDNMLVINGNVAANFASNVKQQSKGTPLWKWCIVFTLIALALETLFIRLQKKA
jgi:hypothetical protein